MKNESRKLRDFILKYFNDDEFDAFCFDYFPEVYRNLTSTMPMTQRIQLLLDYCLRRGQEPDLIAALRAERSTLFDEFLASDPTATLSHQQRTQLEQEYETLVVEQQRLQNWLQRATDPDEKQEIIHSLDSNEHKCREIEVQLSQPSSQRVAPVSSETQGMDSGFLLKLYHALLKLGYWKQDRLFNSISRNYRYGAFLIHGPTYEYGQRWLLNRLVRSTSIDQNGKSIVIDLSRGAKRSDLPAVLREFAQRLGLPASSRPSTIVDKIFTMWQTQNVVIVFHNVDESIKENLEGLLGKFWAAITARIAQFANHNQYYKLYVFFIDNQGQILSWDIGFVDQLDNLWNPQVPLGLPEIESFTDDELTAWIEQQSDLLPTTLKDEPVNSATSIAAIGGGVPERTLIEVCSRCGFNWYDQEQKWLRL